jgi:hypothetical protein
MLSIALMNLDRCLPMIPEIPISEQMPMTTPLPQAGDILLSERSARADVFTVSVVPAVGDETVTRYSAAIEVVKNLARSRQVNGWFTNDHTHYARIASYRSDRSDVDPERFARRRSRRKP